MPHARTTDPETSHAAAKRVNQCASVLHAMIYHILLKKPLTDDQILEHPLITADYAPSTIRTRRNELVRMGRVTKHGETVNARGNRTTLWRAVK